jgi:hypothetical protein
MRMTNTQNHIEQRPTVQQATEFFRKEKIMKTTPVHSNSFSHSHQTTFADNIRAIDMKWIWIATFLVVVVILGVFEPLQAIAYLIENEGLGETGASVLALVAGFTFPMTLGFSVIRFVLLSGWELPWKPEAKLVAAAGVLFVSGFIADALSFGLLPRYSQMISGPFWLAFPAFVAMGYFTSYGVELCVCALVIGTAVALQVERWYYSTMQISQTASV